MAIKVLNKIFLNFWNSFRPYLVPLLLAPVAPLLGWGPITHLYMNKRALDRIEPGSVGNPDVREIVTDPDLRNIFINAGNSVDLIKANNLRNRERFFEYAHNTVPNYFTGDPLMGRFLIEEVANNGNDPEKRAWAYGWLAHQVCDGFAHKIPHSGCEGWVNSRRILGGYYSPEREDESVSVAHARIQLYMADHWLAEMLADCLCYSREREFIDSIPIELKVPDGNEVYDASLRILKNFEKQLGPGFIYFEPLTDEKLRSIIDFYELLIYSTIHVYRAILKSYPDRKLEDFISASPRLSRLDTLLDNSVEAISRMLMNPEKPWEPGRWLPDGSNRFEQSVYEYERIWRPGRYKFGRKTGLMGTLYYNRMTDRIIAWLRDFARTRNMWPLIRLGMGTVYNRGRTQWPIASTFIRTMINRRTGSVEETMGHVARHCRLKKYREIVPD